MFIKLAFGAILSFKRQSTAQNMKCISLDKIELCYYIFMVTYD